MLVDTGSTDGTIRIAEEFGCEVHHFPWTDSFGEARTQTLRHSNPQVPWNLLIDADEVLNVAPGVDLDEHLEPGPDWPYEGRYIQLRDLYDGRVTASYPQMRIIANHPCISFVGRIHNQMVFDDGRLIEQPPLLDPTQVWYDHVGYDPAVYQERGKAERAFRLLKLEIEGGRGDDALINYYLGRECVTSHRYGEAVEWLERAIPLLKKSANASPQALPAYRYLIDSLAILGRDFSDAERRAVADYPHSPDLHYALARAYSNLRRYEEADAAFHRTQECLSKADPRVPQDLYHRPWELHLNWAFMLAEWGKDTNDLALSERCLDLLIKAQGEGPPVELAGTIEKLLG